MAEDQAVYGLALGPVLLRVPPGFTFAGASERGDGSIGRIPEIDLADPNGGDCALTSTYLGMSGESAYLGIGQQPGARPLTDQPGGRPFEALLIPPDRVVVRATSSDLVNIICADADTALEVARHLVLSRSAVAGRNLRQLSCSWGYCAAPSARNRGPA